MSDDLIKTLQEEARDDAYFIARLRAENIRQQDEITRLRADLAAVTAERDRMREVIKGINAMLEISCETLERPTYNSLDVGQRHSPLSQKEIIQRLTETCLFVRADLSKLMDEARAADALEAVLAERDALKAELAAANTRMSKLDFERTAAELDRDAIRDALAARLAPVDDEALVEIVAVYCSPEMNWNEMSEKWKNSCRRDARAAIAAIRPHIEAAERERCAKIAEHLSGWGNDFGKGGHAMHIAAAIRSGK